jgi:hypothetical protein
MGPDNLLRRSLNNLELEHLCCTLLQKEQLAFTRSSLRYSVKPGKPIIDLGLAPVKSFFLALFKIDALAALFAHTDPGTCKDHALASRRRHMIRPC